MREDLKAKAQQLANEQVVSLNSHIDATLAATNAQAETLARMGDLLSGIDREQLRLRFMKFISKTQTAPQSANSQIERAINL
jgi:hypothetical protein